MHAWCVCVCSEFPDSVPNLAGRWASSEYFWAELMGKLGLARYGETDSLNGGEDQAYKKTRKEKHEVKGDCIDSEY